MSEYYTPTIEEFHVGFECEVYNKFSKEWYAFLFNQVFEDTSVAYNFTEGKYRVKYLDKEDIEGLGFEFKGKAIKSFFEVDCWFLLPDSESFKCSKLTIQLCEKLRTVKIIGYIASACEEDTLFEGSCKNKSELGRILKQIGY